MADLSNGSFIPKRGPAKRKRKSSSRQVYVFTFISYILMFATLLGAGGVYFYGKYIDRQSTREIAALNTEINSFNEADMQRVKDFDIRLQQASGRVDNSASVVSIFEALEAATVDTVQLESLIIDRELDDKFLLTTIVETDSFDSTLFQRGVYQRNKPTVESVLFTDIQKSVQIDGNSQNADTPPITFNAKIEIPVAEVPYTVGLDDVIPLTITDPAISAVDLEGAASSSEEIIGNQNEI